MKHEKRFEKNVVYDKRYKKRSAKKYAIKHTPPNSMITNRIVSAGDLSQNAVQMGSTSSNNKEKKEP